MRVMALTVSVFVRVMALTTVCFSFHESDGPERRLQTSQLASADRHFGGYRL